MSHETTRPPHALSEADAESVDALLGNQASVDTPTDRSEAVERLLGLLDLPESAVPQEDRRLLVDVTFARVLRARDDRAVARLAPEPIGPNLSSCAAEAIDEMVATGWTQEGRDERSRKARSLFSLLDRTLEPSAGLEREGLVDATLDRVQTDMDDLANRLRFEPVERLAAARPSFRWRDMAAIAAMLVIACSIFWPMIDAARVESRRAVGQANMQRAALGFGMFANDHDDRLPSRDGRGVDGLWWEVGTPGKSHSANLYALVRSGYASIATLASPGNPDALVEVTDPDAIDWESSEQVSFSYQLFGKTVPRLATFSGSPSVVLADRSPVVDRSRMGLPVDPRANSANQLGFGQLVLFADGRVRFLRTPQLESGDNIWLPGRLESAAQPSVVGTELPSDRADAFVGP